MADDAAAGASPKAETEPAHLEANEDAETRAARRELKQSSISDQPAPARDGDSPADGKDDVEVEADAAAAAARPTTPAVDATDVDQVLSPKKKRAHDQLDQDRAADENDATSIASSDSAKDRTSRLEPEKKRHRDGEDVNSPGTSPAKKSQPASTSAFAASSFGKLATGSSPFATLGASKGSGFGSVGGPSLSSFASPSAPQAPAVPAAAPKLAFGGGSSASPFAGLSAPSNGFGGGSSGFGSTLGGSSGFGSTLGRGNSSSSSSRFGSSLSAKPLPSFAAPGAKPLQSEKPARPFGAPDSDAEDGEDSDDGDEDTPPEDTERAASPEKDAEEKRKTKLQKIQVNDGEAGEATVVSVRAKMFYHDKEAGWKERGGGMLKINVPQACVDFEDSGAVIPGSFDASGLETDDDDDQENAASRVPRLIMRQDQTHRVILNTAIVPAMKFQEKASLKSVSILFTAFEGAQAKPVSITMRMTAANAKSFMNEIGIIQRELRGN